jgi:precorrin-6x reductase
MVIKKIRTTIVDAVHPYAVAIGVLVGVGV